MIFGLLPINVESTFKVFEIRESLSIRNVFLLKQSVNPYFRADDTPTASLLQGSQLQTGPKVHVLKRITTSKKQVCFDRMVG
jgi:hypothetical protein